MKQFFGAFFGSIVGLLITGVVVAIIISVMVVSSFKDVFSDKDGETYKAKPKSVLTLNLDGEIHERGVDNPFGDLDLGPFMPSGSVGLNDIVSSIKKAKEDTAIKGIYLRVSSPLAGFASIEEIRQALTEFKTSGKFIYAYSEVFSQKAYYVASVADKIYLNPQGDIEFKGLGAQLMFFKNALDKLEIDVQVFRHGKFKSAIEPFMLDKMSEANRAQVETYLGSIWNQLLKGVSESRKISITDLNKFADNLSIDSPESALEHKLIDELKYEDEVQDIIRKKIGIKEKAKINYVKLSDYKKAPEKGEKKDKKNKIAIIYAVGEITSGDGDDNQIGSDKIAKTIREARLDSSIKAIVFRVNSPGGSALASDVIWREAVLAKQTKPFIVSMGDVAASGGYYISCAADRIFAEPTTITGSIGVFGLIPNAQKAFANKLGITIDTVSTNKHSDVGGIHRAVTESERAYIQKSVENIYDVFITKVANGRGLSKANVDSIGQGRVWSGEDALKIKLVDELGGLESAVKYAAKKINVNNYDIVLLPKQKDPLEQLLSKGTDEVEAKIITKTLGSQYTYLKHVKDLLSKKGIRAELPYELLIE